GLLAVVAALAVLYVLAQRRRHRYALRYANVSLVREALGRGPGWRRHVPPVLFLVAVGVMVLAMSRPIAVVTVPSQEGTVILTIAAFQNLDPNAASPRPTLPPLPGGQKAPASIVLLTDGQNNQFPPPLAVVDQAASRGVRIYTIGVGSAQGAIVRIQGRQIRTALDEVTLKKIAELTEGEYYNASTETDLRKVYETLTTQLVIRQETTQITAVLTA